MRQKAILLVEDDFLNRRLSKKVLKLNGYAILEAKNSKEVIEILKKQIVDLAILDINLGEDIHEGITIGQYLKDKYSVPFIYLTAYDNAEIIGKAVTTSPYSYLTKPFKNSDLIASVEIAFQQSDSRHVPKISVKDQDFNVSLPISEINYIVSEGNYLLFQTDSKTYKLRTTIKQILEILPVSIFVQVHRAYIVNSTKIEKYKISKVVIKAIEIPVSKSYMEHLEQYR
ncbi:proteobacterial dedicated sortase system response regulator [compost metagenome]